MVIDRQGKQHVIDKYNAELPNVKKASRLRAAALPEIEDVKAPSCSTTLTLPQQLDFDNPSARASKEVPLPLPGQPDVPAPVGPAAIMDEHLPEVDDQPPQERTELPGSCDDLT